MKLDKILEGKNKRTLVFSLITISLLSSFIMTAYKYGQYDTIDWVEGFAVKEGNITEMPRLFLLDILTEQAPITARATNGQIEISPITIKNNLTPNPYAEWQKWYYRVEVYVVNADEVPHTCDPKDTGYSSNEVMLVWPMGQEMLEGREIDSKGTEIFNVPKIPDIYDHNIKIWIAEGYRWEAHMGGYMSILPLMTPYPEWEGSTPQPPSQSEIIVQNWDRISCYEIKEVEGRQDFDRPEPPDDGEYTTMDTTLFLSTNDTKYPVGSNIQVRIETYDNFGMKRIPMNYKLYLGDMLMDSGVTSGSHVTTKLIYVEDSYREGNVRKKYDVRVVTEDVFVPRENTLYLGKEITREIEILPEGAPQTSRLDEMLARLFGFPSGRAFRDAWLAGRFWAEIVQSGTLILIGLGALLFIMIYLRMSGMGSKKQ